MEISGYFWVTDTKKGGVYCFTCAVFHALMHPDSKLVIDGRDYSDSGCDCRKIPECKVCKVAMERIVL